MSLTEEKTAQKDPIVSQMPSINVVKLKHAIAAHVVAEYISIPAPIPYYLPLSLRLGFSYVLAMVRGINVGRVRKEGLSVDLD